MQRYSRADRVGQMIFQIIADTIRQKLDDPRILPVTITQVRLTRDLRLARVYYCLSGDAAAKEAARQGLVGAAGLFKKTIDAELHLRFMPDLEFHYDETLDRAERIEQILKEVSPAHESDDPEDS
ncbi:MAG: ribosome-binding factor A [Deltaproteobacteria bacterium RBG_13_61_14]|nr:MAG: ribosome-binding factor A [Deltaproteobacteria bacterium RBG_13_61_14]